MFDTKKCSFSEAWLVRMLSRWGLITLRILILWGLIIKNTISVVFSY